MSGSTAYSQTVLLKSGVCTIASTGVAQKLSASALMARFVSAFPTSGAPLLGDSANQFAPSLSLNPAPGKYIDLSTIWVLGNSGDVVKYLYDPTFP